MLKFCNAKIIIINKIKFLPLPVGNVFPGIEKSSSISLSPRMEALRQTTAKKTKELKTSLVTEESLAAQKCPEGGSEPILR